jgi:hypothetical protein
MMQSCNEQLIILDAACTKTNISTNINIATKFLQNCSNVTEHYKLTDKPNRNSAPALYVTDKEVL